MSSIKLLSVNADSKTIKGTKKGYLTGVMYLAPHNLSGFNVCSSASPGCIASCLYTAGRSAMFKKDGSNPIREARIKRTQFLFSDRVAFMAQLDKEIKALVKKASKLNLIPVVRLNGTSDLPWEREAFTYGLMQKYSDIQFYDYTKIAKRAINWAFGDMPENYHLTFSKNESNHLEVSKVASVGGNIAVVFSNANYPSSYLGLPTINGDESDLRFLDPKGYIVALKAKGEAKKDKHKDNGFVVYYEGGA